MAPPRQSVPSAIFSASATTFSLAALASACFAAFSALRASRCVAMTGPSASRRPVSDTRSPTALAPSTWAATFLTDSAASSGLMTPELMRFSSSSTSKASAAYRSV